MKTILLSVVAFALLSPALLHAQLGEAVPVWKTNPDGTTALMTTADIDAYRAERRRQERADREFLAGVNDRLPEMRMLIWVELQKEMLMDYVSTVAQARSVQGWYDKAVAKRDARVQARVAALEGLGVPKDKAVLQAMQEESQAAEARRQAAIADDQARMAAAQLEELRAIRDAQDREETRRFLEEDARRQRR